MACCGPSRAEAACPGSLCWSLPLLHHVLCMSFRSQKFSLIYCGSKHTFQVNKVHFLQRTNVLCDLAGHLSPGQVLALPSPAAHVGPHAAVLASLAMRIGGRVSKLPGSGALWGWYSAMHGPYLFRLLPVELLYSKEIVTVF